MDSTARSRDLWKQASKILLVLSAVPVRVPVRERVRERLLAALGLLARPTVPAEVRRSLIAAVCHWEAQHAASERLSRLGRGTPTDGRAQAVTAEVLDWVATEYRRHRDAGRTALAEAEGWVKRVRG